MCVTARSGINDDEAPQSLPRGVRMILKDYSGKEAAQSEEDGLVSTSPPPPFFQTCKRARRLRKRGRLGMTGF